MPNSYVVLVNVAGSNIYPVTDLSAINMTTTNGIQVSPVNGGTIGIQPGYIESSYFANMVSTGVGAATVSEVTVS